MEEAFSIYADRLRDGSVEQIEEHFSPQFMDVHEADLEFRVPIDVTGEASYLDGTLFLKFHIVTEATLPCAICNEDVQVKIEIPEFEATVDREEFSSGVYSFKELLRETILLEVPHVAECQGGKCPERENVGKYISKL